MVKGIHAAVGPHGLRRSQRQRGLRAIGTERRSLAVTPFVRSEGCAVLFASKRFMSLASGVSLWKGKGNRRSPSAPLEETGGAAEKRARGLQSRDANHHASHTGGGSCQRGPAKPGATATSGSLRNMVVSSNSALPAPFVKSTAYDAYSKLGRHPLTEVRGG